MMPDTTSKQTNDAAVNRRLDEWKRRLIDLTRRNRLLYFDPSKGATLTITQPMMAEVFEHLYIEERAWKFWMPPASQSDETDDEKGDENDRDMLFPSTVPSKPKADELVVTGQGLKKLEPRLKSIYRKARTDYQERGLRILYVAFGTLTWRESEGAGETLSPLVLCPVKVNRDTAADPFEMMWADEDLVVNPALITKLHNDFHIVLPPPPEDWTVDALKDFFAQLESKVRPLNWRVQETAHLSFFSFHKLAMYQDIVKNGDHISVHPIVRGFAGEILSNDESISVPEESELDRVQQPEQTFQILDADSSQQQCIQAVLAGRNLVLQGPPGTGKSQTIAKVVLQGLL